MPLAKLFQKKQTSEELAKHLILICSPYGSTGKTTIATNLALELAAQKQRVLLVDADTNGAAVANHFSLSQLTAGLAAALRLAKQNRLDQQQLERLTLAIPKTNLQILPGMFGKNWDTESEDALIKLISSCRELYDFVVVDTQALFVGSAEAAYPRLALADALVFVALADPVGIQRWLEIESELTTLGLQPKLVINRLRNSVLSSARREINQTLDRLGELPVAGYFPDDSARLDQATRSGLPLALNSRSGGFRQSLASFVATELLGQGGSLDGRVAKLG